MATGRLEAPGFFSDPAIRFAYSNAEWYGPSMSILDPIRDVNGAALRIQYGLSTPEREAAEMTGSDFYENLEAIRIAKSKVKDSGVALGIPTVLSTDMEDLTGEGGDEDDEE